jgi:integrase
MPSIATSAPARQAAYVTGMSGGSCDSGVHFETIVHVSQPTRARSAEADLVLLHAMLNWATTVRDPSAARGTRWLGAHPLKGIERRPEKNPRRPVTCQERFDATRRAIRRRTDQAPEGSAERHKWIRVELALVLAEATGRRIGAIQQLRWEDIGYAAPAITWRADADKMGVLWTIDLSARWSPNCDASRRILVLSAVGCSLPLAFRISRRIGGRW